MVRKKGITLILPTLLFSLSVSSCAMEFIKNFAAHLFGGAEWVAPIHAAETSACDEDGVTPLMREVSVVGRAPALTTVEELCSKGNVNAQDKEGWTALLYVFNGTRCPHAQSPQLVATLLKYGANTELEGRRLGSRKTALADAACRLNELSTGTVQDHEPWEKNYESIVRYLRVVGAGQSQSPRELMTKVGYGRKMYKTQVSPNVQRLICASQEDVLKQLSEEDQKVLAAILPLRSRQTRRLSDALHAYVLTRDKKIILGDPQGDLVVVPGFIKEIGEHISERRAKEGAVSVHITADPAKIVLDYAADSTPIFMRHALTVASRFKHDDVTKALTGAGSKAEKKEDGKREE